MQETIFFEHAGVKVTNARFMVHSQTYAMNGVTSVKSLVTPPSRGGAIIGIAIGVLMFAVLDGSAKLVALLVIAGCAWALSQMKNTYTAAEHR